MRPVIALMSAALFAVSATASVRDSSRTILGVHISGYMNFSLMRIVKSSAIPNIESDRPYLNGAWIEGISGGLSVEKNVGARLTLNSGLGGQISHGTQGKNVNWKGLGRQAGAWLSVASAHVKFGNVEHPPLELTAGFFGYNYTRTRDFGGYLVSAGLRPMILASSAGSGGVTGVLLRGNAPNFLRNDIVLTLETERQPYLDVSAIYVPTLHVDDKFEIAAGVNFHRFLVAANRETDPELVETPITTAVHHTDSGTFYETTGMPFGGIKVMGRLWADPIKILKIGGPFWGREDLRLYGECAVLGLEDFPVNIDGRGYPDIKNRIVAMAGLNLPTHSLIGNGLFPLALSMFLIGIEADSTYFDNIVRDNMGNVVSQDTVIAKRGFDHKKPRPFIWAGASILSGAGTFLLEKIVGRPLRLDVITVEVEYCPSPFYENHAIPSGLPIYVDAWDQIAGRRTSNDLWHYDDWRWAAMVSKKIADRLSFNLKLASDHTRIREPNGWYSAEEKLYTFWEWYWELGIGVGF